MGTLNLGSFFQSDNALPIDTFQDKGGGGLDNIVRTRTGFFHLCPENLHYGIIDEGLPLSIILCVLFIIYYVAEHTVCSYTWSKMQSTNLQLPLFSPP